MGGWERRRKEKGEAGGDHIKVLAPALEHSSFPFQSGNRSQHPGVGDAERKGWVALPRSLLVP